MFCRHCGKEIKDQSAFCPYCGNQVAQQFSQPAVPVKEASKASVPKRKKRFGRTLIWIVLVLLLAVGAAGALAYFEILEIPVVSDIVEMFLDARSEDPDDDDTSKKASHKDPGGATNTGEAADTGEAAGTATGTTPAEAPTEEVSQPPAEAPTEEVSEPPAEAPEADPLAELDVGDCFTFGTYEQDNDPGTDAEAIEWIVLDKQPGMLLVISRYALDCQRYNKQSASVTWETSTIRTWLNSVFYNAAFGPDEQAKILTVLVPADENPLYDTYPGASASDKIFLLSANETVLYLSSNSTRACIPTAYAISQNAYIDPNSGGCWWLMRTPGDTNKKVVSTNCDGSIDFDGGNVESDRGAVRPAMWIRTQ